jgi:serine O-acetyltransferase
MHGEAPLSGARRLMHLALPAMQCAILHRVAHALHLRGRRGAASLVARLSTVLTGSAIHPGSRIGPGLMVPHPARVAFCGTAGRDLVLFPASYVGPAEPVLPGQGFPADAPRLGDAVVVGAHAAVQGAVTVGDGAMVGIGVATRRDVPEGVVTLRAPKPRPGRGS